MEDKTVNKTRILFRDTGLFAISNFGSKILVFLLTPLYTASLSTEEYGIIDLITTTVSLIYPVLTFAIADATLRFALAKDNDKNSVFCVSTLFTFFSIIFLLVLKPFIGMIDSSLETYWLVFVLNYSLFNIHNYFSNFVKALGKTLLFAIQGLIQTIVIIFSNILVLAVFKLGLKGYLLSTLIGYLIPIGIMFIFAKLYKYLVPFSIDTHLLKEMLLYSIPMIPAILAWAINTSIDKYMIIGMYGLSESGIYSVAHKIPTIITTILAVFSQAWQLSAIINHGDADESEYFTKVYNCIDLISVCGCFLIFILCKFLAKIFFINDYFLAWKYVPFLTISALFSSNSGILAAAYRAEKKTLSLFMSVLFGAVINVILNYILLLNFGVIGAAIATAVSFFSVWIVRFVLVQKIIVIDIEITKTAITYLLLIVSATLTTLECEYNWIFTIVCLIFVLVVKKDNVAICFNMIKIIKNKLLRKNNLNICK